MLESEANLRDLVDHLQSEVDRLERVERELDALHAAGVDNWEGYDDAMRALDREEDDV